MNPSNDSFMKEVRPIGQKMQVEIRPQSANAFCKHAKGSFNAADVLNASAEVPETGAPISQMGAIFARLMNLEEFA